MTSVSGPESAARVAALLENRRKLLDVVDAESARWRGAGSALGRLEELLAALRGQADASERLRAALDGSALRDLGARVSELLDLHGQAAARFARGTVNLGVSGQARVGKSTLLQSLSGLTNAEIPAGSGIPVTAVRSRICHVPGQSRAVLRLHTPESFLAESVRPYHAYLGLAAAPASLEEFSGWRYPEAVEDSKAPLLQRVVAAQRALWSYREDLVGSGREVPLAELRGYVAYPSQSEVDGGNPSRRYLAVREARIECEFPHPGVGRIGIVDLPGLGEMAADAERRHVAGLRHDVDAVLLVKRPVEGMAYFGAADGRALALLDDARGLVRRTGDFVFLVVNKGSGDPESLAAALHGHLTSEVNAGLPGRHFTVLETDAADPASVQERLLAPVLAALAERLPVMDNDIVAGLAERSEELARAVLAATAGVEAELGLAEGARQCAGRGPGAAGRDPARGPRGGPRGDRRADARRGGGTGGGPGLRGRGGRGVHRSGPLDRRGPRVRGGRRRGRGRSGRAADGGPADAGHRQRWCDRQLRQMRVRGGSAPVATDEFNRIRVEVARRFAAIDGYFEERVRGLHRQVAEVLTRHTGRLLAPPTAAESGAAADGPAGPGPETAEGAAVLLRLREMFDDGYEPCPGLSSAVADLMELRLDYRTQLHPRIRAQLDGLSLDVLDPSSGRMRSQIAVEVSAAGADELYEFITTRAEQAAYRTRTALLRDSVIPALVLYAAVEQFEDALIRSGASAREFRRFARTYRNELWPGRYEGLNSEHARFAAVTRGCREVEAALRGRPAHGGTDRTAAEKTKETRW
ncbi:hypothetical protein ACFQ1I_09545 [Kitasatospora arboriphila]